MTEFINYEIKMDKLEILILRKCFENRPQKLRWIDLYKIYHDTINTNEEFDEKTTISKYTQPPILNMFSNEFDPWSQKKANEPPRQLLAALEYLSQKNLIKKEKEIGSTIDSASITSDGVDYILAQKPINKLRSVLIPAGGVSSYFWGCITGVIGTVLSQILMRYFGLTGK